jgi:hypothetical protein
MNKRLNSKPRAPAQPVKKSFGAAISKQLKKIEATSPHDEVVRVSKIKLSDKKSLRHAVFLNPEKKRHIKRKMDGGYIQNSVAADWMLSKENIGDVFLELKGGDVVHAVEQVCATADFAFAHKLVNGSVAALILCTEHPGISTKIQRLMQKFVTKYKGPIHARNRGGEFVFEHVLSFNGPERM